MDCSQKKSFSKCVEFDLSQVIETVDFSQLLTYVGLALNQNVLFFVSDSLCCAFSCATSANVEDSFQFGAQCRILPSEIV